MGRGVLFSNRGGSNSGVSGTRANPEQDAQGDGLSLGKATQQLEKLRCMPTRQQKPPSSRSFRLKACQF
jgi:hypothetical protein